MTGFYYRDAAAPEPNRPTIIGAAALIEREGALLLDHRLDPPGWALVAGRLEGDESLGDTVRREVLEETGLVVASHRLFGVFSDPSRVVQYADGNVYRVVTVVFTVEVRDVRTLRPSVESSEVRFVPRNELTEIELVATHRPIVDRYLSGEQPPFLE